MLAKRSSKINQSTQQQPQGSAADFSGLMGQGATERWMEVGQVEALSAYAPVGSIQLESIGLAAAHGEWHGVEATDRSVRSKVYTVCTSTASVTKGVIGAKPRRNQRFEGRGLHHLTGDAIKWGPSSIPMNIIRFLAMDRTTTYEIG